MAGNHRDEGLQVAGNHRDERRGAAGGCLSY